MKMYLMAALGMLTILATLPVHADDSIKDVKAAKLNSSHATQVAASPTTSPAQVDNDQKQRGVDCFFADNADDQFCKKLKGMAEKATGVSH